MKTFKIYPDTEVKSCKACPFRSESECTFTDGPKFDDKPPTVIHHDCPKVSHD